jgi:hypothetical protein
MQPVSIVATVLNEVQDIGRLVPSLLAQIPPPAEVIIVDGGSTDGTWEWLVNAQTKHPNLQPIRDESCNLKSCPGPVSRGRNVAIAAARSQIIACADAGCTYAPDWLARITAPLIAGIAEYALGGACLDLADPTLWDLASAPFLGVKLSPSTPSKSCTARSMAFTKDLWRRIGGFPEICPLWGRHPLRPGSATHHTARLCRARQSPLPPPKHPSFGLPPARPLRYQRRHPRRSSRAPDPQRRPLLRATPQPALPALDRPSVSADSRAPMLAGLPPRLAFHLPHRASHPAGSLPFFRTGSVDRRLQPSSRQIHQERTGQPPEPLSCQSSVAGVLTTDN